MDTLCFDIDWLPPPQWLESWRKSRYVLYAALGYTVSAMREAKSSSGKGLHVWIDIMETVDDETRNMLQFLGGDDQTRVRINRLRTERGLQKFWNKLFSEVRQNPEYKGRLPCSDCKIIKYLREMSSENE